MKYEHWGDYVHQKRIEKEITLREFCRMLEIDPSNWSKVERGIANAPKDTEILFKIISTIGLNTEKERFRFWGLYACYVVDAKSESLFDKLPLLINGRSESKLNKLIELLKAN